MKKTKQDIKSIPNMEYIMKGTSMTYKNKYSDKLFDDEYCDCDERCPKCGKKKRSKKAYKYVV